MYILNSQIVLTEQVLDVQNITHYIRDASCGAEVIFIGTVRKETKNKAVDRLFFEAYEPMAKKEMQKILNECLDLFNILKITMHHRLGTLAIREIPVIVGVSSGHREDAFRACAHAMNRLKQDVPIWKKEYFVDGEVWVAAHP